VLNDYHRFGQNTPSLLEELRLTQRYCPRLRPPEHRPRWTM